MTNIDRFLECKSIAFVGATINKNKLGNRFYNNLKNKGYSLIPVNPNYQEVETDKCYPNISSIPVKPEGVLIFAPRTVSHQIVKESIDNNIKNIWIQLECDTPEAVKTALDNGVNLVYGKCIMMYAKPVKGIHKFHKIINRLFAKNGR